VNQITDNRDGRLRRLDKALSGFAAPTDYFRGVGKTVPPLPTEIFMFVRRNKETLQQNELKNRSHRRFVLVFNLETSGQVHIDNFCFPFHPGQALLIHPYQFHHYSHLESSRLLWLFCTFELQPESRLEPLKNSVLSLGEKSVTARDTLIDQWLECQRTHTSDGLQSELLQSALFRLLLFLQLEAPAVPDILPDAAPDELIGRVNRFLCEHQRAPVTVEDLAEGLNLSASRLRYRFRKTAGVSPGSYILNCRINRAAALLRTTGLPIADIAAETGFGSPQAFCRIFKQKTGLTPRMYRK
jgi:AraC-like DNA-binding protein